MRNWPIVAILGLAAVTLAAGVEAASSPAPQLSGAGLDAVLDLREAQLRASASQMDLPADLEIPALVSWTELGDTDTLRACISRAGFGFGRTLSFTSEDDYSTAVWKCSAQYTLDPRARVPFSDSQLRVLYAYRAIELRECLTARGVTVAAAPAFEAFAAQWQSTTDAWSPWEDLWLAGLNKLAMDAVRRDCPEFPPTFQLLGPPLPQPAS